MHVHLGRWDHMRAWGCCACCGGAVRTLPSSKLVMHISPQPTHGSASMICVASAYVLRCCCVGVSTLHLGYGKPFLGDGRGVGTAGPIHAGAHSTTHWPTATGVAVISQGPTQPTPPLSEAARGGSGCLKLPSRRPSGGGADRLELPDDAGPTACGSLGPVTLPSQAPVPQALLCRY